MPLRRMAFAAFFIVIATSCVPPEGAIQKFDPETPTGAVQARGVLVVGVESERPPFAFREVGVPMGFTVDIAHRIAEDLGVELRVIPAGTDGLIRLLDGRQVDIIFPASPLREEWLRSYAPSDPYWVGHQRLLVPESSEIDTFEDLDGTKVCMISHPRITVSPEVLTPDVEVVRGSVDRCKALIGNGDVDAVTGSDYDLITIQALTRGHHIVGEEVTTEGYGAVMGGFATPLANFVNTVLEEFDQDGWTQSYNRWIQPVVEGPTPEPPTMTVEEAGALYPTPVPSPTPSD